MDQPMTAPDQSAVEVLEPVAWGCFDADGIDEHLVYRLKERAEAAAIAFGAPLDVRPLYVGAAPKPTLSGEAIREAFFDLIADARKWEENGDEDGFHYELEFGHHSLLPLMSALGVECLSYPIEVDGEIFGGTETPAEALYRASLAALSSPLPGEPG